MTPTPKQIAEQIGRALRREREAAQLSVTQLAGLADVRWATLLACEEGTQYPLLPELFRLAWALQRKPGDLLEEPPEPAEAIPTLWGVVA